MNVWKLVSAGNLVRTEEETPAAEEGKIRVRVTKLLFNGADAAVFRGEVKTKYPLVMGRFAVGIVASENAHPLFPKGTRVLLHSFCEREDPGTAKRDFSEDEFVVRGLTENGFLRDFVSVSPDDMTPLPDSVNDENALLLHHAALARATVDALDVKKGQHVAVIGANLYGVMICQLLIYRQAAPILIDAETSRLDFARTCGVYYTLRADGDLLDNVAHITGGRLTSAAIYATSALGNNAGLLFDVCAREGNVVISGLYTGNVTINFDAAIRKQLSIHCVWNCADYIETAINLFASAPSISARTISRNSS